ncbi:MAG: hypothetical protein ACK4QP_11070 [Pseudorhizobium sp.]
MADTPIPTMSGNPVFFTLNERFRALQAIRPQQTDNVEPQAPDQK